MVVLLMQSSVSPCRRKEVGCFCYRICSLRRVRRFFSLLVFLRAFFFFYFGAERGQVAL